MLLNKFGLLFVLQFVLSLSHPEAELFKHVYLALDKVLDFIYENRNSINIDGFFGVALGKAQLQDGLNYKNDLLYESTLKSANRKALKILKSIDSEKMGLTKEYQLFSQYLLNSTIWENHTTFGEHKVNLKNQNGFTSCTDYILALSSWEFSEKESDFCIAELINSKVEANTKPCSVSKHCKNSMIIDSAINSGGHDYVILHRLLYLQIAKVLHCKWDPSMLSNVIRTYCSAIYMETQLNFQCNNNNDEIMNDLFLEQVLLCGLEGFEEFIQRKWIYYVLHMQTEYGCFGAPNRNKREANSIRYGCIDHTTGLAAGALSLFLRFLSEKL